MAKKIQTFQKRESITNRFEKFLQETNQKSLVNLISNPEDLEIALCDYFQSLQDKRFPTFNSFMCLRSHLKCKILELSGGKIDIANVAKFPKFRVSVIYERSLLWGRSQTTLTDFWTFLTPLPPWFTALLNKICNFYLVILTFHEPPLPPSCQCSL